MLRPLIEEARVDFAKIAIGTEYRVTSSAARIPLRGQVIVCDSLNKRERTAHFYVKGSPSNVHWIDSFEGLVKVNPKFSTKDTPPMSENLSPPSREDRRQHLESVLVEIDGNLSTLNTTQARLLETKTAVESKLADLRKFASDEEEAATKLSEIIKNGGDISQITDFLKSFSVVKFGALAQTDQNLITKSKTVIKTAKQKIEKSKRFEHLDFDDFERSIIGRDESNDIPF